MKYIQECIKVCRLSDFPALSGTLKTLKELDPTEIEDVESHMDELWGDELPTETEINDFLSFETDLIAEWLGFADWDSLVSYHKEIGDEI